MTTALDPYYVTLCERCSWQVTGAGRMIECGPGEIQIPPMLSKTGSGGCRPFDFRRLFWQPGFNENVGSDDRLCDEHSGQKAIGLLTDLEPREPPLTVRYEIWNIHYLHPFSFTPEPQYPDKASYLPVGLTQYTPSKTSPSQRPISGNEIAPAGYVAVIYAAAHRNK